MKTTHLLSILFYCAFFNTSGQVLIPKFGLSLSTIKSSEFVTGMDNSFSNQVGYTIGASYSIPVKPMNTALFSVQPEISFVQKGFRVDAEGEFISIEQPESIQSHQEFTINYLEIPILGKYELGFEKMKLSIYGGPYVAFGLGGRYKSTSTRTSGGLTETFIDTQGSVKFFKSRNPSDANFDHNIDFGFQVGMGLNCFNKVILEARFGNSFTNLNEYMESKNKVFQFTVGVPIYLR